MLLTKRAFVLALLLTGAASAQQWTTLFDGKNLDQFRQVGGANWKLAGGIVEANAGTAGFLVTKQSYKDYVIRVEFWVDGTANSGVYLRCQNLANIDSTTAYEVNIYDTRPDQTYATGSIVDIAPPKMPVKAAGKWNTFEITAQGDHLVVVLNGTTTVDVRDAKHSEGPIALQWGAGVVRFRKVEIRGF